LHEPSIRMKILGAGAPGTRSSAAAASSSASVIVVAPTANGEVNCMLKKNSS